MVPGSLASAVSHFMGESPVLRPEDSLWRAVEALRQTHYGVVPVIDGEHLVGAVTPQAVAAARAGGADIDEPVAHFMEGPIQAISPHWTGADALRLMHDARLDTLFVVGDDNRLVGLLSPSDLFPRHEAVFPGMVGGMATPFGVYLTNGAIQAGAGHLALISTGFLLFVLIALAALVTDGLIWWLGPSAPRWVLESLYTGLPTLLFLVGVRLLPLSGIHGAEHKVVHAIERGEPLVPSVVRRMPRIHPRCGTNIAVGLSLFLGLSQAPWIPDGELRLLVAVLVTLFFWRQIGDLVQHFITTKDPTDAQLQMGIDAGRELLDRFRETRMVTASPWRRILASGVLHVMAGSMVGYAVLQALAMVFGWSIGI